MIEPQTYAQALHQAISETSKTDHDKVLDNFVKILAQNGDLALYPRIEQEYEKIDAKEKGIKQVQLTTATKVNPQHILDELNKVVGSKLEVKHQIDQNLIGGVVVRVDDTLIDASLRNSLEKLRKSIAS